MGLADFQTCFQCHQWPFSALSTFNSLLAPTKRLSLSAVTDAFHKPSNYFKNGKKFQIRKQIPFMIQHFPPGNFNNCDVMHNRLQSGRGAVPSHLLSPNLGPLLACAGFRV